VPDAVLVLEDGRVFRGQTYGAVGVTVGEAVFATGMTGYQETLTDPSYRRQVVVMTAPHIGNTGINDEDAESDRFWVAGFVVRDPARTASSWRSRRGLEEKLVDQGVVGIRGIDTRALTRHLRERGAMRVGIGPGGDRVESLLERVRSFPPMAGSDLTGDVTTAQPYVVPAVGERRWRVAAIDLGIKARTPELLARHGVEVHVLPASADVTQIETLGVDGVFLSNGPGDPATADTTVELIRHVLIRKLPLFGICFGHQLLGRAVGLGTYKLAYGHRGLNAPVKDLATGTVEITAHNHGFAVDAPANESVATPYGRVEVSHVCLNDDVVEGLRIHDPAGGLLAFSVQYHPEAAAGPHDAEHLFARFTDLLEQRSAARDRRGPDLAQRFYGRPRADRHRPHEASDWRDADRKEAVPGQLPANRGRQPSREGPDA